MAEKKIQARIRQKVDTKANWDKATNFVPLKGEVIIYSDLNQAKIGDGVTKVSALPFLKGKADASDKNPTLAWGSKSTVATVDGVDIHVTMPSNPNTHQSVTDKNPTLAWGAKSAVATIGSTNIHVTMPANPVPNNYVTTNTKQTITGEKTFNAPATASGEQATAIFKTANGGQIIFGKEGSNSGSMIALDQVAGTRRLNFRASATPGAIVWSQPESGSSLFYDVSNVYFREVGSVVLNQMPNYSVLATDSTGKIIKGSPVQGPAGAAGGFGTPTATVDANVGTPSVTITSSGPNTAKVFNFAFKNLKGAKGDPGKNGADGSNGAPGAAATIAVGTVTTGAAGSSASVTNAGTSNAAKFNFVIPRGKDGTNGTNGTSVNVSSTKYQASASNTTIPTGTWSDSIVSASAGQYLWTQITFSDGKKAYTVARQGANGHDGAAAGFGTPTASITNTTGTPTVTVTASGSNTAKVFDFKFTNLKGATGATGSVASFKAGSGSGNVITGLTLNSDKSVTYDKTVNALDMGTSSTSVNQVVYNPVEMKAAFTASSIRGPAVTIGGDEINRFRLMALRQTSDGNISSALDLSGYTSGASSINDVCTTRIYQTGASFLITAKKGNLSSPNFGYDWDGTGWNIDGDAILTDVDLGSQQWKLTSTTGTVTTVNVCTK